MPGGKCVLSFKGDSKMLTKFGESLVYKVSGESACCFCFVFSEWRFDGDEWDRVNFHIIDSIMRQDQTKKCTVAGSVTVKGRVPRLELEVF
ncbi:hypothetical protein CEXT_791461 [Caerostris extrusa]|uniref:Uncharacterized protein n=1 Tax=Caerostris extrusa TaxID=172846 RepID=A0AAV4XBC7_CAEEX|nr:hypothetical protein CEXT_791461 [Caerostris extrusa]